MINIWKLSDPCAHGKTDAKPMMMMMMIYTKQLLNECNKNCKTVNVIYMVKALCDFKFLYMLFLKLLANI